MNQIRLIDVPVTPQQRMAFVFRGFADPDVQQEGDAFRAFVVKPSLITGNKFEWAEALARTPMDAVDQLARLVARA